MESSVAGRYGDTDEARHGCDKLQLECTNLQRDVAFWQSQHELSAASLKALETECRDARSTWEKEKVLFFLNNNSAQQDTQANQPCGA